MYIEIDAYRKALHERSPAPSKENLKKILELLSYEINLRALRVVFDENTKAGICEVEKRKLLFFSRERITIKINPSENWVLYLLHEFTHFVLWREFRFSHHGKLFNAHQSALLSKYGKAILKICT